MRERIIISSPSFSKWTKRMMWEFFLWKTNAKIYWDKKIIHKKRFNDAFSLEAKEIMEIDKWKKKIKNVV